MAKIISLKKRMLSVLFWSIISAAFIGPGTVTTASKAGASFQLALLWALVFSVFATIILQEAAARITIASGKSLGEIISLKYQQSNSSLSILIFLAVAFGCAAYQAGNMLGAIEGLKLMTDFSPKILTVLLALVAFAILMLGSFKMIANVLAMVVAVMGISFIYVAFQSDYGVAEFAQAAIIPSFPEGSSLLIIGLIGTTIVPYNLFLASGISKGQDMSEMRWGIVVAVLIGGIISMAILMAGTQIAGEFSFEGLAKVMKEKTGEWGSGLFAFGLFAAGMTSSVTAPLAAAVTAKSLFGAGKKSWSLRSTNFRLVWGIVLFIGLISGLTIGKPIPAIIMAQAINGVLLPVVAIFLILAVNDDALIPKAFLNSPSSNFIMILLVAVSCFLGINNIFKALASTFSFLEMETKTQFGVVTGLTFLILIVLTSKIFFKKNIPLNN